MENGLLWVAVFVLLISNLCLALKIRRVEKKLKAGLQPASPVNPPSSLRKDGDRIFEIITQQIREGGRHLEDMVRLQRGAEEERQRLEAEFRLERERREAQFRQEQARWEAEFRRRQSPPPDDDPQGAGVVA